MSEVLLCPELKKLLGGFVSTHWHFVTVVHFVTVGWFVTVVLVAFTGLPVALVSISVTELVQLYLLHGCPSVA